MLAFKALLDLGEVLKKCEHVGGAEDSDAEYKVGLCERVLPLKGPDQSAGDKLFFSLAAVVDASILEEAEKVEFEEDVSESKEVHHQAFLPGIVEGIAVAKNPVQFEVGLRLLGMGGYLPADHYFPQGGEAVPLPSLPTPRIKREQPPQHFLKVLPCRPLWPAPLPSNLRL